MSEPKNHTHAPEALTLKEDGLWVGASGKIYAMTNVDGQCMFVELDDVQNAVRVARQATGEE